MGIFGRDDRSSTDLAPPTPATQDRPATKAQPQRAENLTVIARPCSLDGHLKSQNDVLIEGTFTGTVEGKARILVAEAGKVQAKMHAQMVIVAGTVKGDVLADDKIELKPSANLQGNITAPSILIQEGATFEGQVYMQKPADLKAAPKGQSPTGDSTDKESKHRSGEKKR